MKSRLFQQRTSSLLWQRLRGAPLECVQTHPSSPIFSQKSTHNRPIALRDRTMGPRRSNNLVGFLQKTRLFCWASLVVLLPTLAQARFVQLAATSTAPQVVGWYTSLDLTTGVNTIRAIQRATYDNDSEAWIIDRIPQNGSPAVPRGSLY